MRFKGVYPHWNSEITLGKFYSSDIRKLVSLRQYYPLMIPDAVEDAQRYYTERVRADNTLYFTVRKGSAVVLYAALDPIMKEQATFHAWRRKGRKRRITKKDAARILNLLLRYGFEELQMNRITATAIESVKAASRMLKVVGMTHEGTLREFQSYNGIPHNVQIYGILRRELCVIQ